MHLLTRHPLCPACRYDLAGTVAAGRRRCPECGAPFEEHELLRAPRPGDWTLSRGLLRGGLFLIGAGLVIGLLWLAALWSLAGVPPMIRLSFLVACGLGYLAGRKLTAALAARVGFQSWLWPPAVFVTVAATMVACTFVASVVLPSAPTRPMFAVFFLVTTLFASIAEVVMDS